MLQLPIIYGRSWKMPPPNSQFNEKSPTGFWPFYSKFIYISKTPIHVWLEGGFQILCRYGHLKNVASDYSFSGYSKPFCYTNRFSFLPQEYLIILIYCWLCFFGSLYCSNTKNYWTILWLFFFYSLFLVFVEVSLIISELALSKLIHFCNY